MEHVSIAQPPHVGVDDGQLRVGAGDFNRQPIGGLLPRIGRRAHRRQRANQRVAQPVHRYDRVPVTRSVAVLSITVAAL